MRFTCRKCRNTAHVTNLYSAADVTMEAVFLQAPWYEDRRGLVHGCIYCRRCGAVHNTVGSLGGAIKLLLGRVPSKVVFTYDPCSFQKLTRINNEDFPVNAASVHPLMLEAMLKDGRLAEEDLAGKPPSIGFLAECMRDSDFIVRREAVAALVTIGSKEAVDAAIEMLRDEHWDVRRYAARALGNLGDRRAIQPLSELLQRETWQHLVREDAKLALEKLRARG